MNQEKEPSKYHPLATCHWCRLSFPAGSDHDCKSGPPPAEPGVVASVRVAGVEQLGSRDQQDALNASIRMLEALNGNDARRAVLAALCLHFDDSGHWLVDLVGPKPIPAGLDRVRANEVRVGDRLQLPDGLMMGVTRVRPGSDLQLILEAGIANLAPREQCNIEKGPAWKRTH